tara:strand:+ start:24777 stop:25325 length:549 start_codon:yes stop_codon:yes gene_type:complete
MPNTLYEILTGTPIWIYVVFLYLLLIGVMSLRARVVKFYQICIMPIVFATLSMHTLAVAFGFTYLASGSWLGSVIIITILSWRLIMKLPIKVDREHLLIENPGNKITLIVVMIVFVAKYYLGYRMKADPTLVDDVVFKWVVLVVSGACTGLIFGYLKAYYKMLETFPSEDLTKVQPATASGK